MPETAKKVDRSTRWGNPFVIKKHRTASPDEGMFEWFSVLHEDEEVAFFQSRRDAAEYACKKFDEIIESMDWSERYEWLKPIRGHDLACWCAEDDPCHADVLLKYLHEQWMYGDLVPEE